MGLRLEALDRQSIANIFLYEMFIGNSTVPREMWDKNREWYFKIRQNIARHRG